MTSGYSDGGAAVYIIDPESINYSCHKESRIFDVSNEYDRWKEYINLGFNVKTLFPLCTLAPHIDMRLSAQNAVFTLHGLFVNHLDYYEIIYNQIYTIFIPLKSVADVRREIKLLGFTTSRVYPDLSGLASEIKDELKYKGFQSNQSQQGRSDTHQ